MTYTELTHLSRTEPGGSRICPKCEQFTMRIRTYGIENFTHDCGTDSVDMHTFLVGKKVLVNTGLMLRFCKAIPADIFRHPE
jgi:hypothetical protein